MIVGVPKEIKQDEYRVALLPVGAEELTRAGHTVLVEAGPGLGSGISDELYRSNGAEMVNSPAEIYARAELVIKVKEPQPSEYSLLRPGQIVFTYFHFAADASLTQRRARIGRDGRRLRNAPRQAGRFVVPHADERSRRPHEHSGRGQVSRTAARGPRHSAGRRAGRACRPTSRFWAAAWWARTRPKSRPASQADVSILDINVDRLRYLEDIMPGNVNTLYSDRHNIREELQLADLVIGAVLIPGARAPKLVTREDLKLMKPGAVIIDVAIDQGGCLETSRPTTHSHPTYIVDGIVHYCVTNMPGAVGRTSTYALCNVTFPYALRIANQGLARRLRRRPRPDRSGQHAPGPRDLSPRRGDFRTSLDADRLDSVGLMLGRG